GVEADVGEEDDSAAREDGAHGAQRRVPRAGGRRGRGQREVRAVDEEDAQADDDGEDRDLRGDEDAGEARGLLGAHHEDRRDEERKEERGQVDDAAGHAAEVGVGGPHGKLGVRDAAPERDEVVAPRDGDGGRADGVLQDQRPAQDPRQRLAQRAVRVAVGAAAGGDGGGQLGVGQAGEAADGAHEDEGPDDVGARDLGAQARVDEDARADDGADAQEREVQGAQALLDRLGRVVRLGDDVLGGLLHAVARQGSLQEAHGIASRPHLATGSSLGEKVSATSEMVPLGPGAGTGSAPVGPREPLKVIVQSPTPAVALGFAGRLDAAASGVLPEAEVGPGTSCTLTTTSILSPQLPLPLPLRLLGPSTFTEMAKGTAAEAGSEHVTLTVTLSTLVPLTEPFTLPPVKSETWRLFGVPLAVVHVTEESPLGEPAVPVQAPGPGVTMMAVKAPPKSRAPTMKSTTSGPAIRMGVSRP